MIVLTTCHRLKTIDEPKSKEEHAHNDRADMFLQILHRLRDLKWTFQDYFWLCKRKKSNLSLTEILSFDDAPRIMDFRKATDQNPEDNCDHHNRVKLRKFAREHNVPILRFDAVHLGTDQKDGLNLHDERFYQLPKTLELCRGAKIVVTMNLAVEHGIMNGTQGHIVDFIYHAGHNPNHDDYRFVCENCFFFVKFYN